MDRIVTLSPPNYDRQVSIIDRLCRRYPFISRMTVGKSVLGREIIGLRLGGCDDAVLYAGGFHALEWLTTLLLCTFAENLCRAFIELLCARAYYYP